ncbi:MAG: ATP-binding protein [Gemmatimonadaceae bacterium]
MGYPRQVLPRATELSIQAALQRYVQDSAMPFAVTSGREHIVVYANPAFSRLASLGIGDRIGEPVATAGNASGSRSLRATLDRAFDAGRELVDEPIDLYPDAQIGFHVNVWPVVAQHGGTSALGIEIREPGVSGDSRELQRQVAEKMILAALRERGSAEESEAARRRAAFLAEAGRFLAESVDQASTLVALTRLVLPTLGAWCIVDILDDSGAIRRLGIYHSDPEKQIIARKLETGWQPEPNDPFGAAAMLYEPRTLTITEDVEIKLAASAHGSEHLPALRQLGLGPLLTVPLIARGKLLGAITFVNSQPGFVYRPEDIDLAEDLAGRGALALDNAQVYDLAVTLQRSAETANRAKTAFLGAMSHELRTPLNAIGGYIDLLDMGLRGPVTPQQRADFARVKSNQQHLTLLITEILSFARAGSGGISYDIKDVNACDAMKHAIDLIEPLFAQKGLVFDGMSGDGSLIARGDPERVTQILVNLLSNAIKFTPSGGHIKAECMAHGATVSMQISDTGIGIEREKLEAVFEPFVQLKESLADRGGGIGLGLAISRDLAHAMKGDLTLTSTLGKGSQFTLSLPSAAKQDGG